MVELKTSAQIRIAPLSVRKPVQWPDCLAPLATSEKGGALNVFGESATHQKL